VAFDTSTFGGDSAILAPQGLLAFEGMPAPGLPGETLYAVDELTHEAPWGTTWVGSVTTAGDAGYADRTLRVAQGELVDAAGISGSATWSSVQDLQFTDDGSLYILGESNNDALLVRETPGGDRTVELAEGQNLPGTPWTLTTLPGSPDSVSVDRLGGIAATVDVNQGGGDVKIVYSNGVIEATEGGSSPIAGRTYDFIYSDVDRNVHGTTLFVARLDGSTDQDSVLVGDSQVLLREGDAAPGLPAGAVIDSINSAKPRVADNGTWAAAIRFRTADDPDALILNGRALLYDGLWIPWMGTVDVDDNDPIFDLSPNGRWLVVTTELNDRHQVVLRYDLADELYADSVIPSQAGQQNTFRAARAVPGDQIRLVVSLTPGQSTIPCGSGTVALDVGSPISLGDQIADSQGVATWQIAVPPAASGFSVQVRMVDMTACATGDGITTTF